MSTSAFVQVVAGCTAAFLISIASASSRAIYVDASNVSDTEDGSATHPFKTLEPAVELASAGDTVLIAAGLYSPLGRELRTKPGVALIGASAETTTINGEIRDPSSTGVAPDIVMNLSFTRFTFLRGDMDGPFTGTNIVANCICDAIVVGHGATFDSLFHTSHSFLIENNRVTGAIAFDMGSTYGGTGVIRNNECGTILVEHKSSMDDSSHFNFGTTVIDNIVSGTIEFNQGQGAAVETIQGNRAGAIIIRSGGFWTYDVTNNDLDSGIIDRSGACWTTIAHNSIRDGIILDGSGGFGDDQEDEIIEDNDIFYSGRPLDIAYVDPADIDAAIVNTSRSATVRNNRIASAISGCRFASGGPTNVVGNIITVPTLRLPFSGSDSLVFGISTQAGPGVVTGNTIHGGFVGYESQSGATLFADNAIDSAHIGIRSSGTERIRNNQVSNCSGDGMLLRAIDGPVEMNRIVDNAGAGIRLEYAGTDLGGGSQSGIGQNILRRNGVYDLYVDASAGGAPTVYARNNYWDHTVADDISAFDIYDGRDVDTLPVVDFVPFGVSSIDADRSTPSVLHLVVVPNPMTSEARVYCTLPRPGRVTIRVFDVSGRMSVQVIDKHMTAGVHALSLPASFTGGTNHHAGFYLCELRFDGVVVVSPFVVE